MINRRDFLKTTSAAAIVSALPVESQAAIKFEQPDRVFVRLIEGHHHTDLELGVFDVDFSLEKQFDNPLDYRSNPHVLEVGQIAKLRIGDRHWIMNGFDLETVTEKKGLVFVMRNPLPYHPDTSYIVHVIGQGPMVVPNGK